MDDGIEFLAHSGLAPSTVRRASQGTVGDLITPDQLAELWQVSPKTLANQRSRREGPPYVKLSGGAVRYSRTAIEKWLNDRAVTHDRDEPT